MYSYKDNGLKKEGDSDAWSFMNTPDGLERPLDLQDAKSPRV